ncbi:hypothetical protein L6452_19166 [Arctium lappa]|uniref:Uncharacterized protein n=1 Tax=Arctium lappa TaxID=4217 RepID=A0ACB9B8D1_ARCLA|nr:hypothetical protein L6452_19166 [Arctium lappa]
MDLIPLVGPSPNGLLINITPSNMKLLLLTQCSYLRVIYRVFDVVLRELGIGIVPYSPISRGFLDVGPKLAENLIEGDFRKVYGVEDFEKSNAHLIYVIHEFVFVRKYVAVNLCQFIL